MFRIHYSPSGFWSPLQCEDCKGTKVESSSAFSIINCCKNIISQRLSWHVSRLFFQTFLSYIIKTLTMALLYSYVPWQWGSMRNTSILNTQKFSHDSFYYLYLWFSCCNMSECPLWKRPIALTYPIFLYYSHHMWSQWQIRHNISIFLTLSCLPALTCPDPVIPCLSSSSSLFPSQLVLTCQHTSSP